MARPTFSAVLLAAAALAAATGAAAQTMNASSASFNGNSAGFNAGYGRISGSENQPVDAQLTNAESSLELVNSLHQGGSSGSVFSGGAMDSLSGAGGLASTIGDNLTIVTGGASNIVAVDSGNSGDASTSNSTNGKP